ncbi:N-acetylglucosamine-6-phosphate deacetylase [Arthrobacter sp. CDRTa11]|uniref:N-acetylglucosamine-6-phosphate deacetylase n=1 Tax=Arthrobacter sp. CDRTa11 TaxID=2651199 RepID=UPI002265821F|nr:N-acetylglucosamine-6-phosphate deacetylase [Arthrobacter sp. CDRTa11]UZX01624.1 N-acetylglucosamine-6-phosphate deacetylase [Arthrobacter sp. CDRTa11]
MDYLVSGTVITDGEIRQDQVLAIKDGKIAFSGPASACDVNLYPRAETIRTPDGGAVLPGLVDMHCHGAAGGDFPAGHEAESRNAVSFLRSSGTTTLLASVVTAPKDDLLKAIRSLRVVADEGLIAGIHAEGPFLSHSRCGAQDPRWLLEPDLEFLSALVAEAGGHLKTMTYAPELPGSDELVSTLVSSGVIPSLGHTDSDARTAAVSLEYAAGRLGSSSLRGARPTVTHLFNGMPPMHHRAPGPVAACLRLARAGTVAVELIADGVHLDPETVRMVFELVGANNVVLVTDSMAATGLPEGEYQLGPAQVSVVGYVATLTSTGSLAGGTATLLDVVRRTIAAGVSAADAVLAATGTPARLLGLDGHVGSLRTGMQADLLIVDREFRLQTVLRHGVRLPSARAGAPQPAAREDGSQAVSAAGWPAAQEDRNHNSRPQA